MMIIKKEKISANMRVSSVLMEESYLAIGKTGNDYITDTLTAQIESFILSNLNEEKEIELYFKPQGFWDWIFRRTQKQKFTIKCREVLKNPKQLSPEESTLMFEVSPNFNQRLL